MKRCTGDKSVSHHVLLSGFPAMALAKKQLKGRRHEKKLNLMCTINPDFKDLTDLGMEDDYRNPSPSPTKKVIVTLGHG
jgi:hypothetical protein